VKFFRHRAIGCCLALALSIAVSACGSAKHPYDATAENNGTYVRLGTINYQLQISRELNQYSPEDHEYLTGLPAGTKGPTANEIWYGVFLYAINKGHRTAPVADSFKIVDTQGNTYSPVALDPSVNPFAWTNTDLAPLGTVPAPNTAASFGPTQGALLLFKLNTSVYNNRPLTLDIQAPGISHVATISLDL
jgi:hypothetical protein